MAFFKKRIIGFNLMGIIVMAFVAVSCDDSLAEDSDDSDRIDVSNESTDAKGSQKKETEISKLPVGTALNAPNGWTCWEGWYGTNDGCDCGCGVIDPDCDGDPTLVACDYRFCPAGKMVNPTQNHLCLDRKIKIMPVGDSITAGEHWDEPTNRERTGYRKHLWDTLQRYGFDVDFVGSQTHGQRNLNDPDYYDWHNEAHPGMGIKYIADKLKTALPIYEPDILLVHVGTNGRYPNEVKDMLDMINRSQAPPSWVLLCRIIHRLGGSTGENDPTTVFNNQVEKDVKARKNDKFEIIMVDMEDRAYLDYSDVSPWGDMLGTTYKYPKGKGPKNGIDPFHPNEQGNAKIADAFFDTLYSWVFN